MASFIIIGDVLLLLSLFLLLLFIIIVGDANSKVSMLGILVLLHGDIAALSVDVLLFVLLLLLFVV